MAVEFQTTRQFEDDLNSLSANERAKVVQVVNKLRVASGDLSQSTIYQPIRFPLRDGLESSLYIARAANGLRIIYSFDNDPIFDRKLITLFRVVHRGRADNEYRQIAVALYEGMLNGKIEPANRAS